MICFRLKEKVTMKVRIQWIVEYEYYEKWNITSKSKENKKKEKEKELTCSGYTNRVLRKGTTKSSSLEWWAWTWISCDSQADLIHPISHSINGRPRVSTARNAFISSCISNRTELWAWTQPRKKKRKGSSVRFTLFLWLKKKKKNFIVETWWRWWGYVWIEYRISTR